MLFLQKIALLCVGFSLLVSCGERTASQASRLSDQQKSELTAAFDRFDEILKTHAPSIYEKLHDGTTEADLDRLRLCLDGNRVEVLEKWFSWHNGAAEHILPEGIPISVERSVEDQRIKESIPFVPSIRRNSVKILDNLAGDGYFVDVNSEKPMVFYHMLEDPENPVWFGTLAEFVGFIASGFESGVLFENDEGRFDFDEAKYEERMSEYLQRATGWN